MGRNWFGTRLKDGDFKLLWIFCTIVDCGGFARAESQLRLGLPAISRAVKDLETRLKVRVCERGRGGFALTAEGRRVYEAACELLADLRRFDDRIQSLMGELSGDLKIGVLDTLITDRNFCVPHILKQFKTRHPAVHIDLRMIPTNAIEQGVIDGELDIGVIAGRRHLPMLIHRRLYVETCGLYCSEEHPVYQLHGDALTREHLYPYEFACYSLLGPGALEKARKCFLRTADVNHVEAVAALISTDIFFGYLPDHYARAALTGKRFVKVLSDEFDLSTEIELIVRRNGSSPAVASFLEYVGIAPDRAVA